MLETYVKTQKSADKYEGFHKGSEPHSWMVIENPIQMDHLGDSPQETLATNIRQKHPDLHSWMFDLTWTWGMSWAAQ